MKRSVWVWPVIDTSVGRHRSEATPDERPVPEELVGWAQEHGVGEMFLGIGPEPHTVADLDWARAVVELARPTGLRVAALGGDSDWIDAPADALAWLRVVVGAGIFDGVHLDLEPWSHSDWIVRRDELVRAYLHLLRRVGSVCPLPLEVDLAHWLHEVPSANGGGLDAAVMRIVDAVTVLSFRNTVTGRDSIAEIAAPQLATATRLGIPCRLAVETNYLGPDPVSRKQTFHGLDRTALNSALTTIDAMQAATPAYNGVAVQDFVGWQRL